MKITKQNLSILFLFIGGYIVQGQTYLSWNEVDQTRYGDEEIYKRKSDNSLLNGDYKIASTTGSYSEVSFVDGKVNGVRTEYNDSGGKKAQATFKNGIIEGELLNFHQNGKVSDEAYYKHGKKDGAWKRYNQEGHVIQTLNYKEDSKEGKWTHEIYSPQNGITRIETKYYKNDQPIKHWESRTDDGKMLWEEDYKAPKDYTRKEYYLNGKLEKLETYADGKLNGPYKYYFKDGILNIEATYKDGDKVFRKLYHSNGKLREVMYFENDIPNGAYEKYASNGVKVKEGKFEAGSKSGIWKEFDDEKGNLKSEVGYKNNRRSGEWKYYNKAQKLAETGYFVNDERDGLWKFYDLAGDLKKEIEYENGKTVSEKKYK